MVAEVRLVVVVEHVGSDDPVPVADVSAGHRTDVGADALRVGDNQPRLGGDEPVIGAPEGDESADLGIAVAIPDAAAGHIPDINVGSLAEGCGTAEVVFQRNHPRAIRGHVVRLRKGC
jgi:hypothetical protein